MRTITSSRVENRPIGELSKRSGVKIETIRYYERVKMLPAPPRSASGRRVYGTTDLRILAFIGVSRIPQQLKARTWRRKLRSSPPSGILRTVSVSSPAFPFAASTSLRSEPGCGKSDTWTDRVRAAIRQADVRL